MDIIGFALVTGAGSGLGRACALAYAVEGAAGVVFADIDKSAAEKTSAESISVAKHSTYQASAIQVDVADESSVDNMISEMLKMFGRIDYAVNCAGIGVQAPAEVAESSVSEFQRFLQVNVLGMFLAVRAQTRAMKAQDARLVSQSNPRRGKTRGVIINMGSCSSYCATPHLGQYTTSKHAVLGLTRNAALDCAPYDIRINCLCPSWVDTPMVQRAIEGNPGLQSLIERAIPIGRIAQPDEIADLVIFLSSPRSSYVTGSGWIIDGGTTLSMNT